MPTIDYTPRCCNEIRGCDTLEWCAADQRHTIEPGQPPLPWWGMAVSVDGPVSGRGDVELSWARIAYCPFCGTRLAPPAPRSP